MSAERSPGRDRPTLDIAPATLREIERRVLWLATRMIDAANRRPVSAVAPAHRTAEFMTKVGGHQASSASMVGIMTALWFGHLTGADKVAVKPHASPVYHAIKYLTGELDHSYLTRLRDYGGLQAYPSRTKDPDVADFSTGSVGLGATAPLFAAATRRYIEAHFGPVDGGAGRFIALVGDAELDEGNIWEAATEPALQGLHNVMWVVDVNRQSLDRVIPEMKIRKLKRLFEESGWHVEEAKFGRNLQACFQRPGGGRLRHRIDEMSNEEYQSLLAYSGGELRERLCAGGDDELRDVLAGVDDDDLTGTLQDLGGHDHQMLIDAYRACDKVVDRPSVVFAYTIKGWGLPIAGDPMNHAAMLSERQIDELREATGLSADDEWTRLAADSVAGTLCARIGDELKNTAPPPHPFPAVPESTAPRTNRPVSTQETFGRSLLALAQDPDVARRLVTTSADVSVSTGLGGWINKMGVFASSDQPDFLGTDRLLRWDQTRAGHHIELGISEMNLFLLLHALGVGHELHGQQLLPVGTVYDPFVCRGLDALVYGLYNGARFIVAGTPSGVSLASEGGAHQSSVTASIGMELPGLTYAEPAFAQTLDWLLCDGLHRLADPDGHSLYLRLSTRPIDQSPLEHAKERVGPDRLRADVIAGGYRLVEPSRPADVVLASCGAVTPEAVAAAELLEDEGVAAVVLDLTSPDRLYRGWRTSLRDAARSASPATPTHHLGSLLPPAERHVPIVTVHDAASHALAWLGSVFGARTVPVGVDEFGQSGALAELYQHFDLLPDQLANSALVALS